MADRAINDYSKKIEMLFLINSYCEVILAPLFNFYHYYGFLKALKGGFQSYERTLLEF